MVKLIKIPAIRRKGALCALALGMSMLVTACRKDQVSPQNQSYTFQSDSALVMVDNYQPPKDVDGGPGGRRAYCLPKADSTQAEPATQPPKDADGGPGH
ncbi:hypothetical protein [Larkinella arboricola]